MKFTWDEEKRKSNIEKHGLDFDLAKQVINSHNTVIVSDLKYDYGEDRKIAYADVDGVKMCVCYVLREDSYRIISMRRMHDKDWRKINGDKNIH